MTWKELHQRALEISTQFRRCESELLDVLTRVDAQRLFERFGLTSTFAYSTKILNLSEDQACIFIRESRKAREVPQLRQAIESGKLTVSKAKKIAAVLTPANQQEWIGKAVSLPTRALEREVVKIAPKEAVPDRVSPVSSEFTGLHCTIDRETEELLREAQDLVSRKASGSGDVGTTLKAALKLFVEKNSPVRKAERVGGRARSAKTPALLSNSVPASFPALRLGRRVAPPARIENAVHLRDGGRCTAVHPVHGRCESRRWVELHHPIPIAMGGRHSVKNLVTLCSAHHRGVHRKAPGT